MSTSPVFVTPPRRSLEDRIAGLTGAQLTQGTVTAMVVGLCVLFVLSQLHPELLITNTTTAGGDMGAHVWAPQYLRDHLLPHGRISGWAPDWYDGFPALTFYFPLPSILVVLLNVVLPYNIAFKIVTVSGICTLPVAAWAFGRLAKLPFPAPACLAAATLPFLFDTGYSIFGGNIASTLAGEFAFSIGFSLALLFLGVVAGGMQTGGRRAVAAVLFGLIILSHILPTLFALVGGVVLMVMSMVAGAPVEKAAAIGRRLRWGVPVGVVGAALSGLWLVPFVLRSPYMNDMGWERMGNGVESGTMLYGQKIVHFADALYPHKLEWLLVLALLGAVLSLVLRRFIGIFFVIIAVLSAMGFIYMPQGRLWNARLLPFWYFCLYMLAGLLVAELARAATFLVQCFMQKDRPRPMIQTVLSSAVAALAFAGAILITAPALYPKWWSWVPWRAHSADVSFVPGWAQWNYSGYEDVGKARHAEYERLVQAMQQVGNDHGCGRAMWEYEPTLDQMGTPMALMLLPARTNGCIGSMEGLFFESSATVPYHFLNQALLSQSPSEAMRALPYGSLDVSSGVTRLQLLGVKYYMAVSPQAQEEAALDPRLSLVSSVPASASVPVAPDTVSQPRTWNIYEVAQSQMVAPLTELPAVMTGVSQHDRELWLKNSVAWYQDPSRYSQPLAASGPANWPRVKDAFAQAPTPAPVQPAQVSNITTSDNGISFHVDRTGVPVVVKMSYFPNWQASGATGPYRITPNLMVVVPTKNDVSLTYGRTPVDYLGIAATIAGIAGVIVLARIDRRRRRSQPILSPSADQLLAVPVTTLSTSDSGDATETCRTGIWLSKHVRAVVKWRSGEAPNRGNQPTLMSGANSPRNN